MKQRTHSSASAALSAMKPNEFEQMTRAIKHFTKGPGKIAGAFPYAGLLVGNPEKSCLKDPENLVLGVA
jgi:hypothetical protein